MHILIVDDQQRTRQSLRLLLRTVPGVCEIKEATGGREALAAIEARTSSGERPPQLVIMDARMPGLDGLDAMKLIKARWPEVKVVILSMYLEYQEPSVQAGADAFVSKGDPPELLVETLGRIFPPN